MRTTDSATPPIDLSRRAFLRTGIVFTGGLVLGAGPWTAFASSQENGTEMTAADLPCGSAPAPVSFPHFPSRVHAFVWRNWPLVTLGRMARVLRARTADIVRMGSAMGLGEPPEITRDQQARSFLTVIRRNWHLLPYEQLMELLDWSADKLAFTLREDDFLYIKLGSLKPKCEPLRYQAPDDDVLRRERDIARVVHQAFPSASLVDGEGLFTFVRDLSAKPPPKRRSSGNSGSLKFCYSYFALYGDPLLEKHADPYPEGLLAQLSHIGVNGVWLPVLLHKLVPCPWDPQRSADYKERLKNLRALVARAHRYGVRVFLYLNEPRSMPVRFFESRPSLKGVVEGDHAALCTSVPEVQNFLRQSVETVCRSVPDLGGFFTITASENLTNCWSHATGAWGQNTVVDCPRCGKRAAADVISEVNGLFAEGIRKAGTRTRLLAWDWGWNDAWSADVIRQLPPEAWVMSVSEWNLPIERGGVKSEVGEYAVSVIEPGPRAQKHWRQAREQGLQTVAKIQAGNSWELSTVPYIPGVENVARHVEHLHRLGVNAFMLGWTLGGYPSPNLEVASETLATGSASDALKVVAERRFGAELAPAVVTAWRGYSAAIREFPHSIGVVYNGPHQLGPANLLWAEPTGCKATMLGFPYDDVDAWRAIYPPAVFVMQLEKVAAGFQTTVDQLRRMMASVVAATPAQRSALAAECGVAEAAAIHFRSAANQVRLIQVRSALLEAGREETIARHRLELKRILEDEISLAGRLHRIQCADSRIGFEASNQYFYVPVDLMEKVLNCRHLIEHWLPHISLNKPASK